MEPRFEPTVEDLARAPESIAHDTIEFLADLAVQEFEPAEAARAFGRALRALAESAGWSFLEPGVKRMLDHPGQHRLFIEAFAIEPISGPCRFWLPILRQTGVIATLADPDWPVDDGLVSRFLGSLGNRAVNVADYPDLVTVIRTLAPRAITEYTPVFPGATERGLDLTVLEFLLGAGLAPDLGSETRADLHTWAGIPDDRRTPLPHLASAEYLAEHIKDGIRTFVDDPPTRGPSLAAVLADPGLREVALDWLQVYGGVPDAESGLSAAQDSLRYSSAALGPGVVVDLPEMRTGWALFDLGQALGASLRQGLVDEFVWPGLEAALNELALTRTWWSSSWPYLVLYDTSLALVLGPEGVAARHHLLVPEHFTGQLGLLVGWAGDQFLVIWGNGEFNRCYWSGAPDEQFDVPKSRWDAAGRIDAFAAGIWHPDGLVVGSELVRPGARGVESYIATVSSDGSNYGRGTNRKDDRGTRVVVLERFDPQTGEIIDEPLPDRLAAFADEGAGLDYLSSTLLPAPAGLADSPLGWSAGLVGAMVRQRLLDTGQREVEIAGVDGRTLELRLSGSMVNPYLLVNGVLRFPGSHTNWLLVGHESLMAVGEYMAAAAFLHLPVGPVHDEGIDTPVATRFVLPGKFWHYLQPRDVNGSRALRTIEQVLVEALQEAAIADRRGGSSDQGRTRATLAQHLPELTDPDLIASVVTRIRRTVELDQQRTEVLSHFRPD